MQKNDVHFILNPVAGSGKAKKLIPQIQALLNDRFNKNSSLHITERSGEATHVVKELLKENNKVIVAVGGDGTVHESLNGFFEGNELINTTCELAIIKCGTGEDLSRSLHLPECFNEQMELISGQQFQTLDVGRVKFIDQNQKSQSRYFLNECQAGLGGSIVKKVGEGHKYFGGKLAFGMVTLAHTLFYKVHKLSVQIDDGPEVEKKLFGIVIGNGTHCGGGMQLTPNAKMDDGKFDILLIKNMGFFTRIIAFSKVYAGKHIQTPYFDLIRAHKIKISSDEFVDVASDGELLGNLPLEAEVLPFCLKVKS